MKQISNLSQPGVSRIVVFRDNTSSQNQSEPNSEPTSVDTYTRAQHQAALTKARQEEQEVARKKLEQAKKEAAELRSQLAARDQAGLEPLQRQEQQLSEAMNQIRELTEQMELTRQSASNELRQYKLELFKEKEIAKYQGKIIKELVYGQTEEEIILSAESAHQRYVAIENAAIESTRRAIEASAPPPGPTVVAPQNPAYVQPASVPASVNAPGAAAVQPVTNYSFGGNVETAVRNGSYAANRAQILQGMQSQQYQGALGNTPLYQAQPTVTPHVAMPNGVMQPTGIPSVTPTNPVLQVQNQQPSVPAIQPQPTQPQPVPVQQPVGDDPRSMARDAIQRMHTHGPIDPRVHNPQADVRALHADAQRYAAERGITPESAFAERFAQ